MFDKNCSAQLLETNLYFKGKCVFVTHFLTIYMFSRNNLAQGWVPQIGMEKSEGIGRRSNTFLILVFSRDFFDNKNRQKAYRQPYLLNFQTIYEGYSYITMLHTLWWISTQLHNNDKKN